MTESSPNNDASAIVGFYLGLAPDSEGRLIDDIWTWHEDRLEYVHDYIQWLFPLRSRSAFNPDAPLLTQNDMTRFRESRELRTRVLRSLSLMLRFYGLELTIDGEPVVRRAPSFETRRANWLHPMNHNHLRLTRIMASASLVGLRPEAKALQRCLLDIARDFPESVSSRTVQFWERAVGS